MLLQAGVVIDYLLLALILIFGKKALVSEFFGLLAHATRTQLLGRFLGTLNSLNIGNFATTHKENTSRIIK